MPVASEPAVHLRGDGVRPHQRRVVAGTASYNAWNSSISQGGFVAVNPGQSGTTPISINPTEWALTPTKGIMVVTQDNQSGKDEAALLELKLNK